MRPPTDPDPSSPPETGMAADLDWQDGAPRSRRFDDTYFSKEDGLAETRAVFLQGCGLPERWSGRSAFVVGELGFGTGLNILALVDLWRRTRPSQRATLHVFSVEGFPMRREEAARALQAWPELDDLATVLLAQWPNGAPEPRRGWRRVEWPDHGVVLDLAIADVREALAGWDGAADAWFLDGFAPARNPQMWTDEVLGLVAARSAPGAKAATFTVAGAVRRGLTEAGFDVARVPGFGRKKQRLEAVFSGARSALAPSPRRVPSVAIVGAGVAGAALARAFVRLGAAPVVVEAEGRGAGASGNPSALVTPRLDAGLGPVAALYAQAFARASALYRSEAPDAVIAVGALQLETGPRDAGRFAAISTWNGFAAAPLAPEVAAARLNEASAPAALDLADALVVAPANILNAWLAQVPQLRALVVSLERSEQGWRLLDEAGQVIIEADVVCVAGGATTRRLLPGLGLQAVRGQVSLSDQPFTGAPAAWGGYAIPTPGGGTLFGATHRRGDEAVDLRAEDDAWNLNALRGARRDLAKQLEEAPITARAGVRAATRDHLPVAGEIEQGLFVLSGLGGRGFTLAPLLAEAVAAEALGRPGPVPSTLKTRIRAGRFVETG